MQRIGAAAAVHHQANAAARHHRRHRMVGIGDQQHGGGGRRGGGHLAHHAAGIDHRLADAHTIPTARIQHQALAGGIQIDVEDRRQLHVQTAALGAGQKAAQACVLRRRCLQARVARGQDQHGATQAFVVARKLSAGNRILTQAGTHPRRQARQPPQRLHCHLRLRTHCAQPAATMVEHHQHDRQHQIHQQPQHAGDIAGAGCRWSGVGRHVSGSTEWDVERNSWGGP